MTQPVYMVIEKRRRVIPGDEESRLRPGHGYPEHTENYDVVTQFQDEGKFREWVEKEEGRLFNKATYTAWRCTPVVITTSMKVTIT